MDRNNQKNKLSRIQEYHKFLNVIIGMFAFGIGLQCLSSPDVTIFGYKFAKSFLAVISLIFLLVVMLEPMSSIKSDFDELKRKNHAYSDTFFLMLRGLPFIFGFVFLCLIAADKIK